MAILVGLVLAAASARAELVGHGGPVHAVAIAPDGRTAVTGGFDYTVMVWDLATRQPRHRLVGHDAAVGEVRVLSGERAVSAGDDGAVILWDIALGAPILRLQAGDKVEGLAVAPDERLIAAGGWDGKVHRWRTVDGSALPPLDNGERVTALAFSADGSHLAAGGHEGTVRVWRTADWVLVGQFALHDFAITAMAAMPGSALIASVGIDRSLERIVLPRGDSMDPLEGHERPILALAVSPDGAALATGGVDGAILLWDPAAGAAARVLNAHDGPVWSLAFDPSGRRLFSAGNDGIVRQWDASTGMLLPEGATGPAAVATRVVPADPGERQFRKCVICHTVTPDDGNRAGPTLHRLFGREAGSLPGYAYSPALVDSTIVWTEETVARLFEIGPEKLTPGSKMPLQKIQDPADRAALVRYLRRVTEGVP